MDKEDIKIDEKEEKHIMQFEFEGGVSYFTSKSYNPFSLASTYIISADIIVDEAKNYNVDDIIASPVIFLYRHATGLYIKQILEQLNAQVKGHDIRKLYYKLEGELTEIEKNKNLKIRLIPDEQTFKSIFEFYSVSPKSDELRYPDSEIIGSKTLLFLNFKNAQYHAHNIMEYFKNLEENLAQLGFPRKYGFN